MPRGQNINETSRDAERGADLKSGNEQVSCIHFLGGDFSLSTAAAGLKGANVFNYRQLRCSPRAEFTMTVRGS